MGEEVRGHAQKETWSPEVGGQRLPWPQSAVSRSVSLRPADGSSEGKLPGRQGDAAEVLVRVSDAELRASPFL